MSNLFSQEQATIDEMMSALINKFSWIFSAILKSVGKHFVPLGHIILILSQSVFALAPSSKYQILFRPNQGRPHDLPQLRLTPSRTFNNNQKQKQVKSRHF
jgi:hypothetical protein